VTKPVISWKPAKPVQVELLKDFKLTDVKGNLQVVAVQLINRNSGNLPLDGVLEEMKLARANPTTHYPSVVDAVKYFVLHLDVFIPAANKMAIQHQLLEVCTQDSVSKGFYRFVIDRQSRQATADIWPSKIRIVYVGKAHSCDLKSGTWSADEVSIDATTKLSHLKVLG